MDCRTAIVCARGIGDGLLGLVLSHNFQRAGDHVTTFSSPLIQLKSWFPTHTIVPFPKEFERETIFGQFDRVIALSGEMFSKKSEIIHSKLMLIEEREFNMKKTMIDNLVDLCETRFHFSSLTRDNGIVIPSHLKLRQYKKRVIIHPMSSDSKKNWLPEKFLDLAHHLAMEGWSPVFMMSGEERKLWEPLLSQQKIEFPCPFFSNLSEAASFLAESAYMIGNDSGVGHLASNLQLPTLTLFSKKTASQFWRPGWGPNRMILPSPFLLSGRLRQKKWKQALSVSRVMRNFEKLCQNVCESI